MNDANSTPAERRRANDPWITRTSVTGEHRVVLRAQAEDIDALGHVNNLVHVRWVQDVAFSHSLAVGLDVDAYRALGTIFVVRRHELDYLVPALLGDVLEACTWVESFEGARSLRRTEIVRVSDGAIALRAATVWAMVSLDNGRPRRVHADVVAAFAKHSPPGKQTHDRVSLVPPSFRVPT